MSQKLISKMLSGKVVYSDRAKLMAIKDEYGVARFYSQMGFINQLKDAFERSFKIKHHFAPPILTLGRGPRGRPTKYKFGSWMGLVLGGGPFEKSAMHNSGSISIY